MQVDIELFRHYRSTVWGQPPRPQYKFYVPVDSTGKVIVCGQIVQFSKTTASGCKFGIVDDVRSDGSVRAHHMKLVDDGNKYPRIEKAGYGRFRSSLLTVLFDTKDVDLHFGLD